MTRESGGPGVTGLRRFVKRPPGTPAPGTRAPGTQVPGLRYRVLELRYRVLRYRVLRYRVLRYRAGCRCSLAASAGTTRRAPNGARCATRSSTAGTGTWSTLDKRSIACACRACYLLFTHEGAAGGRYQAVPERICHDPDRPLAGADWNELQIPVAMAFFFVNSALGRVVAGYPSPGGVTECELDLEAWDRLAAAYPLLGELTPDTEAIFVNRKDEIFLIPIDMCYSLVGELRLYWQGFDGGAEAREALAKFLAGLRRRAVVLERGPLEMEEH